MINNETHLLYSVLCYEEGHCRRTQHILKVYALAKLFGEQEKISVEDQQILQAAAIYMMWQLNIAKNIITGMPVRTIRNRWYLSL